MAGNFYSRCIITTQLSVKVSNFRIQCLKLIWGNKTDVKFLLSTFQKINIINFNKQANNNYVYFLIKWVNLSDLITYLVNTYIKFESAIKTFIVWISLTSPNTEMYKHFKLSLVGFNKQFKFSWCSKLFTYHLI